MYNNIINIKNKTHAILLVESKLCDLHAFIQDYLKSIVAILPNDKWAQKIENKTYYDNISVNGYASNIKKEDILNIINRFSKTGVEERGIKIYIIYGIEYATSQAVNSLLKFLEEPPKNTYAILTTRSINLVLPTIKSRCQTYILKSNIKSTNEKLNQFKLTIEQKQIISRVYHSYDDINTDLRDNTFNNAYNLAKIFIDKKNDLISIKQLQEQFAKFNYKQIELVLKILIAILPNNEKLFELLTNINVNPIKILLFDNIWSILQSNT